MRIFSILPCVVFALACASAVRVPKPEPVPGLHEPSPAGTPEWNAFITHVQDSLQTLDPAREAAAAVMRGNCRLLALQEFALVVPGYNQYWQKYRYGVYVLPDGGELLSSVESNFLQVAHRYAEGFNRYILEHSCRPRA